MRIWLDQKLTRAIPAPALRISKAPLFLSAGPPKFSAAICPPCAAVACETDPENSTVPSMMRQDAAPVQPFVRVSGFQDRSGGCVIDPPMMTEDLPH